MDDLLPAWVCDVGASEVAEEILDCGPRDDFLLTILKSIGQPLDCTDV